MNGKVTSVCVGVYVCVCIYIRFFLAHTHGSCLPLLLLMPFLSLSPVVMMLCVCAQISDFLIVKLSVVFTQSNV